MTFNNKIMKQLLRQPLIKLIFLETILLCFFLPNCNGHGRLIEPPSRATAWRYGFQTPPNYNDHELYCGGFTRQWKRNNGKCGVCGDAWDAATPRPHEFGGKWGQGVIVRKYNPAADITLRVELTASHMGYFEFRVCPDVKAEQECLDKYLLNILGGSPIQPGPSDLETRFYPRNGSRIYEIKAKLPSDLKCDHCVLQWRYIAGNNWGTCEDGKGAVGCGPQEEFRACADISIGDSGRTTMRPFRPGVKPTTPSSTESETPETGAGEEIPEPMPYITLLIILLSLLVVLCAFAAIYLYYYHGQRVKQLLHWKRNKESSTNKAATNSGSSENENTIINSAPVPPPRTKRLSQVKDIAPEEPSIMTGQSSTRQIN